MNKTILIVDDEPVIRNILKDLLLSMDYHLEFACDGFEALQKLPVVKPDLILLDVMMPLMSGLEVTRQIKSHPEWQSIPIILVTALDGRADVVRGLDAGADDFVRKPFDHIELLARVRSMLRIKAQYDLLERRRQELETSLYLNGKFSSVIARHLEELEVLHNTGLELITNLDSDSVLTLIAQTAREIIPETYRCFMHLTSDENEPLLPVVFFPETTSKMIYPHLGVEPIIRQVLTTQRPTQIANVTAEPYACRPDIDGIRSLLVVPMVDHHQLIGTLSVASPNEDAFTMGHEHSLSILADQAAVAIAKARFFETTVKSKEAEKVAIRRIFQRYVSPAVVDSLVNNVDDVTLGGRRREISVLFADIRNFSRFTENSPSESVVEILNHYFSLAVEAILAEQGTLDKFMGDAVMAIFNAPLFQPDSTLRAVRAALAMQRAIIHHNITTDHDPLLFGIGIHVGPAVVGNIGAPQQMNYTAIGDTVNLAKRLQERAEGGQILLSQAAFDVVQDQVMVEELGVFEFKGRASVEQVYRLVDLVPEPMAPN
ncbi:MAG: response regulator [Anaerolineaceae bacterium]|nr:response regulator [Anaerolineaceae bacterium]MCB9098139.1 response regulator [Anaerolineales bacterium]